MKRLLYITCILLFAQCSKNLEFDSSEFKILLPKSWKEIELKGIDSKVFGALTLKKDTVIFDYGLYSSSFKETIKVFSKKQIEKYDSLQMDTKDLKWSKSPEIDQNQAVFHKEFYYYELIDGNFGKICLPKKDDKGLTGISFRNINNSENHLTIMGRNLDSKERNELLKSFQTIKFK